MEGFRDIFWRGDQIVWRNLLRHYVLCLEAGTVPYMLMADLALQLRFIDFSESMGNHDSKIVGADSVD
jgi:hypothetical protein